MGRILYLFLYAALVVSCSEWENDIYKKETSDVTEPDNTEIVTQDGQLYNMSLDYWTKSGSNEFCYATDASESEKLVWATPNATTSFLGYPTCVPEREFVAVEGPGKTAVKLQTRLVNALVAKKLASGCLFTGQMGDINITKMNATLKWGVPFTLRPKSMEGYACYKPVQIDNAKAPYENMLGETDKAHLYVVLADWTEQFIVDPAESKFLDADNDPAIIGYGIVTFDHVMEGYEKFSIEIEYRNSRTPRYLVIVAASSRLGDYFTGGDGSTLYLDEFKFNY